MASARAVYLESQVGTTKVGKSQYSVLLPWSWRTWEGCHGAHVVGPQPTCGALAVTLGSVFAE